MEKIKLHNRTADLNFIFC